MALVCAKAGYPAFFGRKEGSLKTTACSILFATRSAQSVLLRCHVLLTTLPGQENILFPEQSAEASSPIPLKFYSQKKAAGCFIIGSLTFQMVVNDPVIFISPIIPCGLAREAKFLCEICKHIMMELSCRMLL